MADSYIWRVDFRGVKIKLIRIVMFMCIGQGSHGIVRALSVHAQCILLLCSTHPSSAIMAFSCKLTG